MKSKYHDIELAEEEVYFLLELEGIIGLKIPIKDYQIHEGHLKELYLRTELREEGYFSYQLEEIPSSIGNLQFLEKLNLLGNQIVSLPDQIGNLSSLKYLNLRNNELQSLPTSIGQLKSLKRLVLDSNKIKNLPDQIGGLSSLENLSLDDNELEHLPESIGELKNLKTLTLNSNKIKNLPNQIGGLFSLEILSLGDNELESLPMSIDELKNLNYFNLNSNKFKNLPSQIGSLSSLEKIFLVDNELESLPMSIGELKKLDFFNLNSNKIKNLPDQIGGLSSLDILYLDDNELESLPESIGELKSLVKLELNSNKIKILPNQIGDLSSLGVLSLRDNLLEDLPTSIGKLKNLSSLTLDSNKIKILPDQIGDLSSLRELDLAGNKLESLPLSIGGLKNLEYFYLANNKFKDIRLGDLDLSHLDLRANELVNLPRQLNIKEDEYFNKEKILLHGNIFLNFDIIPYIFWGEKYDKQSASFQKNNLSYLCQNELLKLKYWKFLLGKYNKFLEGKDKANWSFRLFHVKKKGYIDTLAMNRKEIPVLNDNFIVPGEISVKRKHPNRKENFIRLLLFMDSYYKHDTDFFDGIQRPKHVSPDATYYKERYSYFKFLYPFIKSITITAENDKGDNIPVVFTDFYFKNAIHYLPDDESEFSIDGFSVYNYDMIIYQSTAYLKFDPSYSLEAYARLKFTDVKIEFEDDLLPTLNNDKILTEKLDTLNTLILLLEKKISTPQKEDFEIRKDYFKSIIENPNLSFTQKDNLEEILQRVSGKDNNQEDNEEVTKKIIQLKKKFEDSFIEQVIPDIILTIGSKHFGWLGKLAEYLMAGIVFASALPSLIQFVLNLFWEDIPFWIDILTYLPLIIFILIYFVKFIIRHRTPKI